VTKALFTFFGESRPTPSDLPIDVTVTLRIQGQFNTTIYNLSIVSYRKNSSSSTTVNF